MDMSMDETGQTHDGREQSFWSWFGFWIQFFILGVFAAIGAFVASEDARPGDYLCGLLLSLGTLALGFLRLKDRKSTRLNSSHSGESRMPSSA